MKSFALLLILLLAGAGATTAQDAPRPAGPALPLTTPDDGEFAAPSWSPDGRWIVLTRPNNTGLWVATPDGQTIRQLSDQPGVGFGAAWSPDGSTLLARLARTDGLRREFAAVMLDVETGETEVVTDLRSSMPDLPRWSADGSEVLLYADERVERIATGRSASRQRVDTPAYLSARNSVAVVSGNTVERRAPFDQPVLNVTPSPDGSRVAFEVLGKGLYVMNSDGSGLVDLGRAHRPSWSPDGEWLVVMQTQDDGHRYTAADLVAVRADGGDRVHLTETRDRLEMSPAWSPDGSRIAFEMLDEGAVYLLPIEW